MVSPTPVSSNSSLHPSADLPFLLRRRRSCVFSVNSSFLRSSRSRYPAALRLSASLAQRNVEPSWLSQDLELKDDFNGWAVVESPAQEQKKGFCFFRCSIVINFHLIVTDGKLLLFLAAGLPKFVIGSIGASTVVLLAAIAHFSLSKKGQIYVQFLLFILCVICILVLARCVLLVVTLFPFYLG